MFDVFISHASEDKVEFVRPLANSLKNAGIKVWYDEFSLKLGDSLRESIDYGLSKSEFGIIVLSKYFFDKNWPKNELNGLFAKEQNGVKTILPIWHNIGFEEVLVQSPMLADRYAVKSDSGLDNIINEILKVIRPELSFITKEGISLSISPSIVTLSDGEWSNKSLITVSNLGNSVAYSVYVKIQLQEKGLNPNCIHIENEAKQTMIQGEIGDKNGSYIISADTYSYSIIDSQGYSTSYIFFYRILAKNSREFVVYGPSNVKCSAEIKIMSFELSPANILQKDGSFAMPMIVF